MTNIGNSIDSSRTRISQQQEQKQEHQEENNNYYQHDYDNHARARAREGNGDQSKQLRMIAEAYRANVARTITPIVAHMIEDAMAAGMDCDTIIWACEETGLAPNPSPRYLRAVLRNWSLRGHVSSRVHAQERHIQTGPWYQLPQDEYLAASKANGENPEEWWWLE